MPFKRLSTTVAVLGALAVASPLLADNTTAANALFLPADGTTKTNYVYGSGGSIPERWYVARLVGGHSYSIQLTEDTPNNTQSVYIDAQLFAADGTSAAPGTQSTNANTRSHYAYAGTGTLSSGFAGGFRNTYTPAAATGVAEHIFIRVRDCCSYLTGPTQYTYFRISVVDTTQFATWFFTNTQYEAFTQIQNTSNGVVTGNLTHYSKVAITGGTTTLCGTPVAFSVPPLSSTFIQASANGGCLTGGGGSILTHNGPPGAIHANVTSVNVAGTGLTHSFNVAYRLMVSPALLAQ